MFSAVTGSTSVGACRKKGGAGGTGSRGVGNAGSAFELGLELEEACRTTWWHASVAAPGQVCTDGVPSVGARGFVGGGEAQRALPPPPLPFPPLAPLFPAVHAEAGWAPPQLVQMWRRPNGDGV